jgi:hypothetical protein
MRRMLAEGENTNYVPLRGAKRAAHAARKTSRENPAEI